MTKKEMFEKMESCGSDGASALHMRSESIQQRQGTSRIPLLKKALKKKSKLLLVTELAVPFNPETGVSDETWNTDNKWRPPYSATFGALYLKSQANENETLKKELMQRAGVSEWDTSDTENFTVQDWTVFIKYRVPRIFTVPVVSINIPVMTNGDFAKDYAVSVARDPMTGEVVGEVPGFLKVNKMFRDKIYEEIKEYDDKVASGELKKTEQQQSEDKSAIRGQNPVSDDHPSNWVEIIEIPVTNQYKISDDINTVSITAEDVKSLQVLSRKAKNITTTLDSYKNGEYSRFDKYFDFYEMDMGCPVEGDADSKRGKMTIGKDTKYEKPSFPIFEYEDANKIISAVREFLDNDDNLENKVRRSMFIAPYTEETENQLYASLETVLDIAQDPFMTKKVLLENTEVITLAFGNKGMELIDEIDAGISTVPEGQLDVKEAIALTQSYDLGSSEFVDDVELCDVELEQLEV